MALTTLSAECVGDTTLLFDNEFVTSRNHQQNFNFVRVHYAVSLDLNVRYENMNRQSSQIGDVTFWTPVLLLKIKNDFYYPTITQSNLFAVKPLRRSDGRYDFNGWSSGSKKRQRMFVGFIDIPMTDGHFRKPGDTMIEIRVAQPVEMGNPEVMYEVCADVGVKSIQIEFL